MKAPWWLEFVLLGLAFLTMLGILGAMYYVAYVVVVLEDVR